MSEWNKNERRKSLLTEDDKAFFRSVQTPPDKRYAGFKIQEIAVIGSIIIALITFHIQTRDIMNRLVISTDWLTAFAKNSDNYHSTTLGVQFEQGKPANPNYDYKTVRTLISTAIKEIEK